MSFRPFHFWNLKEIQWEITNPSIWPGCLKGRFRDEMSTQTKSLDNEIPGKCEGTKCVYTTGKERITRERTRWYLVSHPIWYCQKNFIPEFTGEMVVTHPNESVPCVCCIHFYFKYFRNETNNASSFLAIKLILSDSSGLKLLHILTRLFIIYIRVFGLLFYLNVCQKECERDKHFFIKTKCMGRFFGKMIEELIKKQRIYTLLSRKCQEEERAKENSE